MIDKCQAAAAKASAIIPHFSGVSMTAIISTVVALGIGFGLGWYIKGRGMTGVKIDLNNIKTDVENLKAKILPAPTPAVQAPVA